MTRARKSTTSLTARLGFGDLTFFDELFEFGAALQEFESALFLDRLGGVADVVAATAYGAYQSGALDLAAEFTNGRKRAFAARFRDFCVYRHVRESLSHALGGGNH